MEWGVVLSALGALVTGSVGGSITTGVLERRRAIWVAKRDACMSALKIVDAHFSNIGFEQEGAAVPVVAQQPPTMAEIRDCHNLLATTCKRPEVLSEYLKCFGFPRSAGVPSGEQISLLRAAIRRELKLRRKVEFNRDTSYIALVEGAHGPYSGA